MTRKQIKLLRALGVDFSSSDYFEDTSWYNRRVKPTGPGTMTMLLEPKKPKYPCKVCGEKKMSYKNLICNRCYLKRQRDKNK